MWEIQNWNEKRKHSAFLFVIANSSKEPEERRESNKQKAEQLSSKLHVFDIRVHTGPKNLESPGFYCGIFQDWKVLEKATGLGKFWKSVKLK